MDPIFKGCTRPPMLAGAPMEPLIFFCVPIFSFFSIGSLFHPASLFIGLLACVGVWFWMKSVSEKDEQRLMQKLRVWWHRRCYWATFYIWISRDQLAHHHGLFSYAPTPVRKVKHLQSMPTLGGQA